MLKNSYFLSLIFFSCYCLSGGIETIKSCKLDRGNEVKLISLRTVDGNTPYLMFDNIIVNAFLDGGIVSGDIVLSKCIKHSLIFALNYGPPYIKGCLITALSDDVVKNYRPKGVCFAERNTPDSVWFGENHTLIIIKNNNTGELNGKYIIYDSREEDAQAFDKLPDANNYKIYRLNVSK